MRTIVILILAFVRNAKRQLAGIARKWSNTFVKGRVKNMLDKDIIKEKAKLDYYKFCNKYPDWTKYREEMAKMVNDEKLEIPGDVFDALEIQDPLQIKYTGGTVFHMFLGEQPSSWEAVKDLVRTVTQNFHLPYFTITPSFSICPIHGYLAGVHEFCPTCDQERGLKTDQEVRGGDTA